MSKVRDDDDAATRAGNGPGLCFRVAGSALMKTGICLPLSSEYTSSTRNCRCRANTGLPRSLETVLCVRYEKMTTLPPAQVMAAACASGFRVPRGKLIVYSVNSHTNNSRIGWHLSGIDLTSTPGLQGGLGFEVSKSGLEVLDLGS